MLGGGYDTPNKIQLVVAIDTVRIRDFKFFVTRNSYLKLVSTSAESSQCFATLFRQ
jgi:hypothetical protein